MGPLPKSKGYDYLLVVIDRLMSQVHLVPTDTCVTSKGVTWLFLKEVVRLHGVPDSIMSDRDTKFTASFWKELHRLLGTKLLMSTAFHPQTDGAMERANRSIAQVLQALICNDQKNWANMCPAVEFALNSNVSATTGYAPFELNHGYMPQLGQRLSTDTQFTGVKQFAQQVLWNLTIVHDTIIEHHTMQTHHANRKQTAGEHYSLGDLVYYRPRTWPFLREEPRSYCPSLLGRTK